ncbi:MAG: glycosyltransferase family 4 protein [Prevotella sp.]|nr:glycosyltransferase family 4 protein [Prevotella sp.]
MRVLIVNTSERTGGAAVAANRLMAALNNNGVKAKMLVRDKQTDSLTVCALPRKWKAQWDFLWERLIVWMHLRLRWQNLFAVDIANSGTDITRLPEFQEADIIHLHWVNQGMLSLKDIRRILDSGKRVVWTMHDIWPATAICHLTLDCRRFEQQCSHCRLLPGGGGTGDLAAKTWRRKEKMLDGRRITFVTCSRWLAGEAGKSGLLKGQQIVNIPNPIDTHIYHPTNKSAARKALGLPAEGRIILFVSQRADNPNKGMQYLTEACRLLAEKDADRFAGTSVAILGGHAEEVASELPFPTHTLGYVNDEQRIATVYNAADVFVLPSLSENLPNTIMEAMACGTPCIGFNIGGIPEEIDHRDNGYVAEYRSADDLAAGLRYVLCEADYQTLSHNCTSKVARCWSQQSVANRYIDVYEQALRPQTLKR